jgi:hypothetical protein
MVCNDGYTARDLALHDGSHVIINMIDNHCLKFPSLRYEAGTVNEEYDVIGIARILC